MCYTMAFPQREFEMDKYINVKHRITVEEIYVFGHQWHLIVSPDKQKIHPIKGALCNMDKK